MSFRLDWLLAGNSLNLYVILTPALPIVRTDYRLCVWVSFLLLPHTVCLVTGCPVQSMYLVLLGILSGLVLEDSGRITCARFLSDLEMAKITRGWRDG